MTHKKLWMIFFSTVLMMGCSSNQTSENQVSKEDLEKYKVYYQSVLDHTEFETSSVNFTTSLEMVQVEDGTYRYYIIIDNPCSAMYDVVIMTVENDIPYEENDKMMPSSGIFDNKTSLVPGQVNTADGYAKGLVVSGESSENTISLKIEVEWTNEKKTKTSREYLSYGISYSSSADIGQ